MLNGFLFCWWGWKPHILSAELTLVLCKAPAGPLLQVLNSWAPMQKCVWCIRTLLSCCVLLCYSPVMVWRPIGSDLWHMSPSLCTSSQGPPHKLLFQTLWCLLSGGPLCVPSLPRHYQPDSWHVVVEIPGPEEPKLPASPSLPESASTWLLRQRPRW
jgi:hypothetical protein